jgi:hypothetical protein
MGPDRLHAEAFTASRDTHHEHPFGDNIRAQAIAQLKEFLAFHQPLLENLQSSDLRDLRPAGDEFDHAAAVDQQPLLIQQGRYGAGAQVPSRGHGAPHGMARLIEGEPLEGTGELREGGLALIGTAPVRGDLPGLFAQEVRQLDLIGQLQLDVDEIALDLLGNESHRRADYDELPLIDAGVIEVPQPAPDRGRFPQRVVEVLQVEDCRMLVGGDKVQRFARAMGLRLVFSVLSAHPLGDTPGPHRYRRGVEKLPSDLPQHP